MCKTIFVIHRCGHTYQVSKNQCTTRQKSNRGCSAIYYNIFHPCRPSKVEKASTSLCHRCQRQQRGGVSSRAVDQRGPTSPQSNTMDPEGERTRRIMEGMNRSREREEAHRAEVRRKAAREESSRRPRERGQSSRDRGSRQDTSKSKKHKERGFDSARGDRRPRVREPIRQSQGRSRLEGQARSNHLPVRQTTEQYQPRRSTESRGFNWSNTFQQAPTNNRFSQSQTTMLGTAYQTHEGTQPAGFSNNAYHSYWEGRRAVSPLTAEDMDFERHPAVYIPEHDEYPEHCI